MNASKGKESKGSDEKELVMKTMVGGWVDGCVSGLEATKPGKWEAYLES